MVPTPTPSPTPPERLSLKWMAPIGIVIAYLIYHPPQTIASLAAIITAIAVVTVIFFLDFE